MTHCDFPCEHRPTLCYTIIAVEPLDRLSLGKNQWQYACDGENEIGAPRRFRHDDVSSHLRDGLDESYY